MAVKTKSIENHKIKIEKIELKNIKFKYPNTENYVFKNLNLSLKLLNNFFYECTENTNVIFSYASFFYST